MTRVHAFRDDALQDGDAVEVAHRIATGDISAREAIEAAIERVRHVNPALNGLERDLFAQARARADERKWGVFASVPTLIKDNLDIAGVPTRDGSLAVAPRPAKRDSDFTRQVLSTGAQVIGKSTMPEFGFSASTEYEGREATHNPWNPTYSSGASSGGSAALVAAGAVPFAHANDGGGSIRIPAAVCGLVGLKPTRGRVALNETGKSLPIDMISDGIVTRSVRDTAHFYAATEQFHKPQNMPPLGLIEGPGERKLKIGLVLDSIEGNGTDAETRALVENVARTLEKNGHNIEPFEIPTDETFADDFTLYWGFLAFGTHRFGAKAFGPGFDASKLESLTLGLSAHFKRNMHKFPGTLKRLKAVETQYREAFRGIDVVLSPTLAHITPKLGFLSPENGYETLFSRLREWVAFTPLNNIAGSPAISLPLGQSSEGTPIGVHFSAAHGDERTLLELGFELEESIGFARIQD